MLADISSSTDNILFPTQATGSATLSLAVFAWRGSQEGLVSAPRIPPPALHLVPPLPSGEGQCVCGQCVCNDYSSYFGEYCEDQCLVSDRRSKKFFSS